MVAAAGLDMPVERVEAGVQARVGEPAAVDARVGIENALGRAMSTRSRARPPPRSLADRRASDHRSHDSRWSSFRSLRRRTPARRCRARIVAPGASERNVNGRRGRWPGSAAVGKGRMSGEMQFYLVAIPAVILLGLSKGGFSGLSSLAMPMMSLGLFAGQGGGHRAADSHRAGLGQRLGVSARLFAQEPHHPDPLRGDRRRRSAGCLRRVSATTWCVLRSA